MSLIDIHRHGAAADDGSITIRNLMPPEIAQITDNETYCSIGTHPWFLSPDTWENDKAILSQHVSRPTILAIGEAGLDRLRGPEPDFQQEAFTWQARLAEQQQKPLIIHCVRAFDMLFQVHKKINPVQTWIIHGFDQNEHIARQCRNHGILLSFGPALLRNGSNAALQLQRLRAGEFFLETDEGTQGIAIIYKRAAEICNTLVINLEQDIEHHFNTLFFRP